MRTCSGFSFPHWWWCFIIHGVLVAYTRERMFKFPFLQGVITVGGEDASIVCSHFGNKVLICISHYQKFGTLVSTCTNTVDMSKWLGVSVWYIILCMRVLAKLVQIYLSVARCGRPHLIFKLSQTPLQWPDKESVYFLLYNVYKLVSV